MATDGLMSHSEQARGGDRYHRIACELSKIYKACLEQVSEVEKIF
jgi:hypothetical protein